jgi:small-conductance mechanosensitive channel
VFENGIYLFFTHPFDIGDEIRFEGSRYTVKSMTLQVVKLTASVGKDVTVPTAEMRNSRLHNITRCPSHPLLQRHTLCLCELSFALFIDRDVGFRERVHE